MEFCVEPKSLSDIMQYLGLKDRQNVMNYIDPMIGEGTTLKMTKPDNPISRNQIYVTSKEV